MTFSDVGVKYDVGSLLGWFNIDTEIFTEAFSDGMES